MRLRQVRQNRPNACMAWDVAAARSDSQIFFVSLVLTRPGATTLKRRLREAYEGGC